MLVNKHLMNLRRNWKRNNSFYQFTNHIITQKIYLAYRQVDVGQYAKYKLQLHSSRMLQFRKTVDFPLACGVC